VDLIAEGTIDEKIVKSLRAKLNIASQVMGEEFKEWLR
jgi:SNF2 family DNA or RNA helicase